MTVAKSVLEIELANSGSQKIKSAHLFESFIPLVDSGLVIPELEIIAIRQTGLRGFNCPPPTPSPLPPPPSLTWCCEPRTPYPPPAIYCVTVSHPWWLAGSSFAPELEKF